jgi:hypothetical protein
LVEEVNKMPVRTFYNQGKGIIYDETKGTNGTKYDVRIIDKDGHDEMKAFSVSETDMNTILSAFRILDEHRFGSTFKNNKV